MERRTTVESESGGGAGKSLPSERVALALGSNRGDRAQAIARAVAEIAASGVEIERASSLYETAAIDAPAASVDPAGEEAGRDFLNAVIIGRTALTPHALLSRTQEIERLLGRDRSAPRNAARTIDIDILTFGRRVMREPALTIPHASCHERHFVLVPWAEIDPHAVIPEEVSPEAGKLEIGMAEGGMAEGGGDPRTVAETLADLDARTAAAVRPRVERWGDRVEIPAHEGDGR